MDAQQLHLVSNNVALARFLARKAWERASHALDLDELTSLAYQGLVSAALRYRSYGEEHGYSEESISSGQYFSVFARKRIVGSMLDSMREADHVTRNSRRDYKLLQAAGYTGRLDNIKKLMEETGLSEVRIRKVCHLVEQPPISTDSVLNETPEFSGVSTSVEDSAVELSYRELLTDRWDNLSGLQRTVVAFKYYEELELKAIAAEMNLDIAIIREAHNSAIVSIHEGIYKALG